jgi:hypothetical protein
MERILERKAYREAGGADDREEVRGRHAERVDGREHHEHEQTDVDEAAEERGERLVHADALHGAAEPPRELLRDEPADHENRERGQDAAAPREQNRTDQLRVQPTRQRLA